MQVVKRSIRVIGTALAAAGVLFLILNIWLDGKIDFTLPIIFLTLGPAFFVMARILFERSRWAALLYPPGAIFLGLGIVFLLNVLTGDWQSWAYAWMLPLSGLGIGLGLAARDIPLRREFSYGGAVVAILGITGFALFGAIAGGMLIRIMAPVLLALAGLALRFVRLERLLPTGADAPVGAGAPLAAGTPVGAGAPAGSDAEPSALYASIPGEPVAQQELWPQQELGAHLAEPLSARELEVLRLIEQGLSNSEIAARLTLAPSTVKTHISNIYGKLGVQTRVQAIRRMQELRRHHPAMK